MKPSPSPSKEDFSELPKLFETVLLALSFAVLALAQPKITSTLQGIGEAPSQTQSAWFVIQPTV